MKVAWLIPEAPDMDWSPAIRLRRLHIHEHAVANRLIGEGLLFRAYGNEDLESFAARLSSLDVVVFGGQSEYDFLLMRRLKQLNPRIALVRDHCEDIWGLAWEHECFAEATSVVCSSHKLAQKTAEMGFPAHVIEESYEPVLSKTPPWRRPLVTGYMGGDYELGEALRPIAEGLGYTFIHMAAPVTPLPPGSKAIHWTREGWPEAYSQFRVSLLPQRPMLPAKSPVKIVQALGNNIPVACSPLDAYTRLGKHGETVFFCETQRHWKRALELLADDEVCRSFCEAISAGGFANAYSLRSITKKWIDHFIQLKIERVFNA